MNSNSSQEDRDPESGQIDEDRMRFSSGFQEFVGRFRLRTVLTVSLVLVLVIAIGLTWLLAYMNSQYAVGELSGQLQDEISDRIEQHLDTYLKTPHLINQLCQDSIRLGELDVRDPLSLERHFRELSYRFDTVEAICYGNEREGNYSIISRVGATGAVNGTDRFVAFSRAETNYSLEEYRTDRAGNRLEHTLSKPGYDPRTRPWYKASIQEGGPAWTPIYMWLEGVVSQDAVVPAYSDQGELLGVLDTSLTLSGIGDFLQNLRISKHGQAYIMERSGQLVASSTIREPYSQVNGELVRLSAPESSDAVIRETAEYILQNQNSTLNLTSRQKITQDIDGVRNYVQVTPYQDSYGLDWLIVVVIPESDVMGKIDENNNSTLVLLIFSIIGTIIVCIYLARWITEPVLAMNRSAKALAAGDWRGWKELDRRDELGELSHSFKLMADQLRTMFASLKSSEERYINLFQSSADAILLFDGFSLVHMNRAAEEMFAISGSKHRDADVREIFGQVGCGIADMILTSMSSQDPGYQDQTISRTSDKTEQFMNIRLTRVPGEGKSLHLVLIRDITDQRKAYITFAEREALTRSYTHIQRILQFLPDPTFVIDQDGHVLIWNQAMEQVTGTRSEEIIGAGDQAYSQAIYKYKRPALIDIALHPDISDEGLYQDREQSGDVLRASFWIELSGEKRFLSVIAARLYDAEGHVTGAIESVRDITPLKMAEEALLLANKKLGLLSSITRHDIINKVMISKAHLVLLGETDLNADQAESVSVIQRSIDTIEHFIAFTRTYQELGVRIPIWQDVREVFDRAAAGVEIGEVQIHNEVRGVTILADSLFEKVCYNLIENAIRHGEHTTRIDISAQENSEGMQISITDDGCGVKEEIKEKIFDRGYGKNTGYGLFLAREILAMSEITITENGRYGVGSRFVIDVPKGKYHLQK